jgi:glyoxylase-like metal-dependent hydrolase (beta-lactamase superfamily II)
MVKKFSLLIVLLALIALVSATATAQDAKAVLQAASTAMGAGNLKSIQYSGTGWNAAVGQSYSADEDWPRFEMTSYTRIIDYDTRSSREDLTRRQGTYPPRGGGGTPLQGEQRQINLVNGNFAWNMQGTTATPAPATAELRQLDLWLSPHGFLKAAMAPNANPTAVSMTIGTSKVTIVSFTALGKFKVNGTITSQNLVERVQTWVPNPVFGDMVYEHRYTEYKDFNGVKFPTVLHSHQGDPRLNPGHNWMEVRVTDARPNPTDAGLTVPDAVRSAQSPAVTVQSQRLANGVWHIAGGSHHSLLVEFRDFVAVVEAPQDEARSLAVIAEVQKLVPNKPMQYIVNTHHHFDHSGGLRTYLAHGATVVTHQANREFYEDVFFYPSARTLQPDVLSSRYPWFAGNRVPPIEPVNQKYVVTDGARVMEMHPVQGLDHNSNMLIVYLPAEKILVNADLYSPPAAGAQAPAANANMRVLRQNIQRLRLDVAQHVGLHGAVGAHDQFVKIVGTSSN